MHSFVSFRLTSHICIYSALLCLFSIFQRSWECFALLIALSLLACFAATNCRSAGLRGLCSLLPLLSLLAPVYHWAVMVAVGLAVVYLAVFLISGRFSLELWRYRPEVIFLVVASFVLAWVTRLGFEANPVPLPMCLACTVLAFLALRALRLGKTASAGWQLITAGAFFLPVAASAATAGVIWAAWPLLGFVFSKIGAVFGWLIAKGTVLWDKALHGVDIKDDFFETKETLAAASEEEAAAETFRSITGNWRLLEKDFPWGIVVLFVLGAALIALIAWLLWRSRPPMGKKFEEGMAEVEVARESGSRRKHRRRSQRPTNRDMIRSLYRDYLMFLSRHGIMPKRSATTEEITLAAASILTQTDELLRALYRKVRYSTTEPTDEEVARARTLFAQLTQEENLASNRAEGESS